MAKRRVKAGTSKTSRKGRIRLFLEGMVQNAGNRTKAAEYAGYKPGRAAEQAGYRLSKDVVVRAALESRQGEVLAQAQDQTLLTAKEVLRSGARDLRFDPAKLYYQDGPKKGQIKPIWEMDEDTRLALRGTEVDEIAIGNGENKAVIGQTVKVKFPEKTAAREQMMKHFGLYEVDNKQKPSTTVQVGVLTVKPDELHFEKVRARALAAGRSRKE